MFRTLTALLSMSLVLASPAAAQFLESEVTLIHTLTGDGGGEFFGYVSNRVADLDGDGADELIVGAPFSHAAGANAGRAYLISGAAGTRLHVWDGLANEYLGAAVNDAGDVNNDGVTDVIVGSSGVPFGNSPSFAGRVTVYSGATFLPLWSVTGEVNNDYFGYSVAGLRDDIDADGQLEVLAGAANHDTNGNNAGRAYVLSGASGAVLRTYDGVDLNDFLGSSIDSIEDLDGDGRREVVVGGRAAGVPGIGRVYVRSSGPGGAVLRTFLPNPTALRMGWFFTATVGDVDLDGTDDVYAPDFVDNALGNGTGRAYVFSGATGAKIREWQGEAANEGFGIGRGAGDVNGDGAADLYMAAYTNSTGAVQAGKGYVLSGGDSAVLRTMTCTIAGALLGYDAHALNDANGDGAADFVLTGTGHDAASVAAADGVVFVIAGIPPCPGDVNGDALVDLVDLALLLSQFGCTAGCNVDLDHDGDTDLSDLAILLSSFGASC